MVIKKRAQMNQQKLEISDCTKPKTASSCRRLSKVSLTKKSKISSLHLLNSRKAQMKIQQMAFMLIAITLLFILAGMFVLVIKLFDLKESATKLEEENALLLVSKLANSPEFSCGNAFGSSKINCVDSDKVMILRENIQKYGEFWGVLNIEIRKITEDRYSDVLCDLSNYPNCGIIRLRDKEVSGFDASNFISLCRKDEEDKESYDKCEIARILVSYESEY